MYVYSSLKVLVLYDNLMGDKGLTALGQALEHNVTLTSLVLGSGGHDELRTRSPRAKKTRVKDQM